MGDEQEGAAAPAAQEPAPAPDQGKAPETAAPMKGLAELLLALADEIGEGPVEAYHLRRLAAKL